MDYGFARRPVWVLGHVLVLVAVLVLTNLGLWQLRRLDERKEANERVEASSLAAPLDTGGLASLGRRTGANEPSDTLDEVEGLEFRRATVNGMFDADHQVLVGYRTNLGLPGYHLVTPLQLVDVDGRPLGHTVLVNRGFVPRDIAESPGQDDRTAQLAPPTGVVEITGVLRDNEPVDLEEVEARADGALPRLQRVDIEAIDAYVPGEIVPLYVELQRPVPSGFPVPLPPLDLTNGPHLSYAVQWFCFAAVTGVGWLAVLRRQATKPG